MKKFIGILVCVLMLFCPFLRVEAEDEKPEDIIKVYDFVTYFSDKYPIYNDYVLYGIDGLSVDSLPSLDDYIVKGGRSECWAEIYFR